jgi:hypothetical protein
VEEGLIGGGVDGLNGLDVLDGLDGLDGLGGSMMTSDGLGRMKIAEDDVE